MEADFIDEIINSRAEMYSRAVVARLKAAVASAGRPDGRIWMVFMMIKLLVGTLLEFLNERIRRHEGRREIIDDFAFYRLLAMFLFSQSSGINLDSTIDQYSSLGFKTATGRMSSKIGNEMAPDHPSLRHAESAGTWRSQRDLHATRLLNDFERQAWCVWKRVFFVPLVQSVTLDDEVMGTRSANNQLKMPSDRKPDR